MYIEQCVSLVFLFGGKWETFVPPGSSRVSGSARQNLCAVVGNYLGTAVAARVKLGMRNVRRVHLTDIWSWYRVELRGG